jgi:hypothetical protein
MLSKIAKHTLLLLCGVLLFAGCEGVNGVDGKDGADGKDGVDALNYPLELTLSGSYGVAHPNVTGVSTNYVLLTVGKGDYTKGDYTLGGTKVTPTPVLTDGGRTTLVKLEAPSIEATTIALAVKENGESVLNDSVTFDVAGTAAPGVLYGEKPMTFSEFFHDVTANIAAIRPSDTAFAQTGPAAVPVLFITSGTRTGNSSAGIAGGTPKWTDTDAGAKVDVISSATYGDNPHFVPTGNLAINYNDPMTKADGNVVTGIKAVEVGVDFDLFANADLLRQNAKAVATSTAVLTKVGEIARWKAATAVYKAKYLRPDASWGRRDDNALNDVVASWPKAIGGTDGATVGVSYGGTWADKVIAVDFAPLTAPLDSAALWNDYFESVYAGYVEDLQTGHREPLVWLQQLFSHRGHTNLEAAIQRPGISRMDSLSPSGNMRLVIFARGFKDIIVESVTVAAYEGQSSASIEQGAVFLVTGTDAAAEFKNSVGTTIPKELHVTGLSADALEAFAAADGGGKLLKGSAEVPAANYTLVYEEEDGEIAITLKDGFFDASAQGTYSFKINDYQSNVFGPISFTVNRITTRPKLQQGSGAASDAASSATALSVTTAGGDIAFDDDAFAKAITPATGRGLLSSIAPAATGWLKNTSGGYVIDASVLTSGAYTLTIRSSGFATADGTSLAELTYYITVQ